ncbi:peptidyl-prolyl cis-trans isomerase FKBP19, chloroplastic isoform X2 [Dendrobium catenatum]|uniref:peptidyl-prolyl cis-trans isomerase FKBP19, chloroplastic isoform X2 n=1 Tax=Dendrobium catenatum TaxID=906689 RepID=UPI00109F9636|nr:peptidyl-prolyl cis-trans isomerase FKBP19, chloroplastic isoform X2 [Dendrobium catenatum]
MGSPASAEISLQMIGRPCRSFWRKASAPGFSPCIARRKTSRGFRVSINRMQAKVSSLSDSNSLMTVAETFQRRELLLASFIGLSINALQNALVNTMAIAAEFADMPALRGKDYGKTKMRYPDYTETQSGLQYKDLRDGDGPKPKMGEIVVVDWDGYTIGYYGRIFEARNKTKGGSFEGEDKDFFKFKVGSQQQCRIIVPPELGYPDNDFNKLGPRPTTFSGQRALDFVLRNQGLIDKTLLFDIELLKIISN